MKISEGMIMEVIGVCQENPVRLRRGGSFLVYLPPGRGAGSGIYMGEALVFTYTVFVGVDAAEVFVNLCRGVGTYVYIPCPAEQVH